jgi:hypothetical protein
MNEVTKLRIDDVKEEVNKAPLANTDKDCLKAVLDSAAGVSNGHPDKIQGTSDLLRELVILDVRRAARQPGEVSGEVRRQMEEHVKSCPMLGSALPKAIAWTYPLRWPITVVVVALCFAPQSPAVINAVLKLAGK